MKIRVSKRAYLILLFIGFYADAQQLPLLVVPKTHRLLREVQGDLDKDGNPETVRIYHTNQDTGEQNFKRELYICKMDHGSLRVWKKNLSVIWNSRDYGFYNDSLPDVEIKNNTLVIAQKFQSNSRHQSVYRNIFRFQKGDFYLIGATTEDSDNCLWESSCDINFSTRRVIISKEYDSCEDDGPEPPKDEYYDFKYAFPGLHKMDGFTPGKTYIKMKPPGVDFDY